MGEVAWEYEKREAKIGECKVVIRMDDGGWVWSVTSVKHDVSVTGRDKLQSRAEERSINAAAWLNAGMPATEK